ncbi:MAG: DUF3298 domain-containing protein [Neisseriaceae bacterium]|nr:DUF3298 domain-containing protein [Neisseriaceae bacterium]
MMFRSRIYLYLLGVLMISACSKQVTKSDIINNDNLSSSTIVVAENETLYHKKVCAKNNKKPDEFCANECQGHLEISIKTNIDWLNKLLNDNKILLNEEELKESAIGSLISRFDDITEQDITFTIEDVKNNEFDEVDNVSITKFEKQHKHFAVFSDFYNYFECGMAHNQYGTRFRVFDLNKKQEIQPTDIIIQGKETELAKVLYDYANQEELYGDFDFIKENLVEDFSFYFEKNEIVFHYGNYRISGFAQGEQEISVPYTKLKGIIKDEFLQ